MFKILRKLINRLWYPRMIKYAGESIKLSAKVYGADGLKDFLRESKDFQKNGIVGMYVKVDVGTYFTKLLTRTSFLDECDCFAFGLPKLNGDLYLVTYNEKVIPKLLFEPDLPLDGWVDVHPVYCWDGDQSSRVEMDVGMDSFLWNSDDRHKHFLDMLAEEVRKKIFYPMKKTLLDTSVYRIMFVI